jgi:hypothetical protein
VCCCGALPFGCSFVPAGTVAGVRAGGRLEPSHGHCAVSRARPYDVISSCLPGGFGDDSPSGLIVTGRITQPQRLAQQQAVAVAQDSGAAVIAACRTS